MTLLFHEIIHLLFSLLTAFIFFFLYQDSEPSLLLLIGIALTGGLFIDSDHLLDHFIGYKWKFDLLHFFRGTHFKINRKIYVLFHGYEYTVLLVCIGLLAENSVLQAYIFTLAISAFFHLFVDVMLNDVYIQTYSIIYRILHNFDIHKLSPKWKKK